MTKLQRLLSARLLWWDAARQKWAGDVFNMALAEMLRMYANVALFALKLFHLASSFFCWRCLIFHIFVQLLVLSWFGCSTSAWNEAAGLDIISVPDSFRTDEGENAGCQSQSCRACWTAASVLRSISKDVFNNLSLYTGMGTLWFCFLELAADFVQGRVSTCM